MSRFKKHLPAIKVPHYKNTMELATVEMPLPQQVLISMSQHIGAPCTPQVAVGDQVQVGQVIGDSDAPVSAPIHSSVSGEVSAIGSMMTTTGNWDQIVFILPDGQQTLHESVRPPQVSDRASFLAAVRASGLVGLGGAAFPTHVKFNPRNLDQVDTLVVNGAECEPFITSDYRTMLEESDLVVAGIKTIMRYLEIKHCRIGIESNKPEAIAKLSQLTADDPAIEVVTLRSSYPQGAERVLIYETTGRKLPLGKLPADVGVIVSNITSVATLENYLQTGLPLISKKLTVDGSAVTQPQNVRALIGTPIVDVIEFCGGYRKPPKKIIMGGPMMGRAVFSDQIPIIKNNNAILAFDQDWAALPPETPCINCGRCVRVCPVGLLPALINKAYQKDDLDELQALDTLLCMECGSCAYVCPAKRPISFVNRFAKEKIKKGAAK